MAATAEVHITAKDQTQQAFAAVRKNIDGVTHHLGRLKGELLALVGVTGFVALIERTLDSGVEMEKLSKQLGASTEALSQFKLVAELAHVSFEALTKGWQFMEKNVSLAAQGLGPATRAFQALGLSAKQLKELQPEVQFTVLAEAFSRLQNASDRTKLAVQVFGKAGAGLIPVLREGAEAIQAARREADQLGLTLDQHAAHQMAEAHEALVRLKGAFHGVANSLVIYGAPALASVAAWLSHALPVAVQKTLAAFVQLQSQATRAFTIVLMAVEALYRSLGQLPTALGAPFRAGAEAAQALRQQLERLIQGQAQTMASLQAQGQVHAQVVKGAAAAYAALYDPALQAMASVNQKQAAAQRRALKAQARAAQRALKAQERLAQAHVQKLTDIFSSGLFQFMDSGFKGMVDSFKNSLQHMVAEAAATELTGALFKALPTFSNGHGFLSQLVNHVSHVAGALFGGFRAGGGDVLAGRSYIVGERGPEYFMPQQNGQIIPNGVSAMAQALPPISIVMHIQTPDAASFKRSSGQISAALGLALQQAVRRHT